MKMQNRYEDTHQYDDIMDLPHHVSKTHPQMALSDRAAQFSPFQALTGYSDAVKETARLTDEWADLDEESRDGLDRKLALLQENMHEKPEVTILYFRPDEKKTGGTYCSVTGIVRKIDMYAHKMIMADGTALEMEYIVQMDGRLFDLPDE